MTQADSKLRKAGPRDSLLHACVDVVLHPKRNIFRIWSWKTAAMSAVFRAGIFLFTNRHTGLLSDLGAGAVEAVFSIFASGLLGAVTQRLRNVRPLWATALTVWLGMPALMLVAQLEVHRLGGTAHVRAGLISSFVFAAIASGFTWFAMRRGVLLVGPGDDSVAHDLRAMPRIVGEFVLWPWRRN